MKNALAILSVVITAGCGSVYPASATRSAPIANGTVTEGECPTASLKGFRGTFKGVLSPVSFQGQSEPLQNLLETHTVTGCTSFAFEVHYSSPQTGLETRQVVFSAEWDKSKGFFIMTGPVIQGQFRIIREGQFVASFETNFSGNPAHCEEMMTVMNNDSQVVRSVQCASGGPNGASLGVRNALVSRVP